MVVMGGDGDERRMMGGDGWTLKLLLQFPLVVLSKQVHYPFLAQPWNLEKWWWKSGMSGLTRYRTQTTKEEQVTYQSARLSPLTTPP